MGKFNVTEEKALINYNQILKDSFEEKVCVFFNESNELPFSSDHDDFDDQSSCMEKTLFWESQGALLQEVLERYSLTGSKLKEEIKRMIEIARDDRVCNCPKHKYSNGCMSCLRQKVVHLLCQRGFQASLCTSQWKQTNKFPGGKQEYIEVIVKTSGRKKQIPYLLELELKEQFEIAKACEEYKKLIFLLPKYYIGKADYLNTIVGIICESTKRSMKDKKIHIGPWRKRSFMRMKWSSSSTNDQCSYN